MGQPSWYQPLGCLHHLVSLGAEIQKTQQAKTRICLLFLLSQGQTGPKESAGVWCWFGSERALCPWSTTPAICWLLLWSHESHFRAPNRICLIKAKIEVVKIWIVLRKCPLPFSPSHSFHLSFFCLCLLAVPPPIPALFDFWCLLFDSPHIRDNLEQLVLCCVANPHPCPVCSSQPHLHCICVMSPVCHVVVPSVSEESPSASESGVLLSQDPSAKPVLLLPPKKPAAFSGDHEETPVKQLSLLKQPPALPPKPTARIANHLTGESRSLWGRTVLPSLQGIVSFLFFLFTWSLMYHFGKVAPWDTWVFPCVSWYMQSRPGFVCLCPAAFYIHPPIISQEPSVACICKCDTLVFKYYFKIIYPSEWIRCNVKIFAKIKSGSFHNQFVKALNFWSEAQHFLLLKFVSVLSS